MEVYFRLVGSCEYTKPLAKLQFSNVDFPLRCSFTAFSQGWIFTEKFFRKLESMMMSGIPVVGIQFGKRHWINWHVVLFKQGSFKKNSCMAGFPLTAWEDLLCFRLDYFSGVFVVPVLLNLGKPSLKRTANLPLKMDGWCTWISFWDNFNLFLVSGKVVELIFENPDLGCHSSQKCFCCWYLTCDAQSFIM